MAVFPIRLFGDPVLRQRAKEVGSVDDAVRKLMKDMLDTMKAAPGVGLAAPQIGISRRVIVWQNEDESGALADPVMMEKSGDVVDDEACLSLPGLSYPVKRARFVKVRGMDPEGTEVIVEAQDLTARILQHEIDHVDGVLFIDHISPEDQKEARRKLRERLLAAEPFGATPAI